MICRLGLALDPTRHYAAASIPPRQRVPSRRLRRQACAGLSVRPDGLRLRHRRKRSVGSLQSSSMARGPSDIRWAPAPRSGVMAALLAAEGFVGSIEAIEGRHGFLKGYSDEADPAVAVHGLGTDYETMKNRPQAVIRAALHPCGAPWPEVSCAPATGSRPEDVIACASALHPNGITLTGAPIEKKRRPRTIVEGQFSMPFTAALMLDQGRFGWDDYSALATPPSMRCATGSMWWRTAGWRTARILRRDPSSETRKGHVRGDRRRSAVGAGDLPG